MNAQINEDYVSFETAKLLKEKSYKGSFNGYYNNAGYIVDKPNTLLKEPKYQYYERVSLYMTMKWLREVHNLHINIFVTWGNKIPHYQWSVDNLATQETISDTPCLDFYEKACETAIRYCLENLI